MLYLKRVHIWWKANVVWSAGWLTNTNMAPYVCMDFPMRILKTKHLLVTFREIAKKKNKFFCFLHILWISPSSEEGINLEFPNCFEIVVNLVEIFIICEKEIEKNKIKSIIDSLFLWNPFFTFFIWIREPWMYVLFIN